LNLIFNLKFFFFSLIVKVGGMRVSAPRPRHTSHGEEKNTEGNQETSGDNAAASEAKEGEKEATNEDAENEETTRLVNRILKILL
jgi:hypothetical protein